MRSLAITLVAIITLATGLARLGVTQTIPPASCHFDTSAHAGVDSFLIALAPGSRIANRRDLRNDYLLAADVIRQYYRPPERVRLPLWARLTGIGTYRPKDVTTVDPRYGLDGEIQFRLDTLGRLANDSVVVQTLAEDLAESVASAIRRADSAAAFGPPSKRLREQNGMIRLHFAKVTSDPGDTLIPVLRVVVPTVRVDQPPEMLSRPPLQYPDELRRRRISGRVVFQLVVGTDGRPALHTVSIVQGEYREFMEASLGIVEHARFKPARIGQCDIPALVRIPIDFTIRR